LCSRRLVLRSRACSPLGFVSPKWTSLACPGRSAARSGALQTRDRGPSSWRSRISDALLADARAASHPGHAADSDAFVIHLTISNSPARSRGAFFASGACNFASLTRIEGWAERRETFGCQRHSPGAALPPPSAPAALQRRAFAFGSVQRAPRTQVVVPGGRGPCLPGQAVTSRPPQDATPRSAFRIVSGDAPQ
jgi:hypothetical protein